MPWGSWVIGLCCGGSSVCAMGFVGHAMVDLACVFLLWLCVDFLSLGCRGFYFCGCGLIFLGSYGSILVVVVAVGVGCG